MRTEEAQLKLDRLKQDQAMLTDLQTKLQAAGKSTDPNEFFKAMIQSGNPDHMAKGYEGMQRYQELQRANDLLRREAPELFGTPAPAAAAAPAMRAAPAPAPALTNALGSGMFGLEAPAPTNALAAQAAAAPAAAPAASVNALAAPEDRTRELRNKILLYSSSGDPRLKAMADVYKTELQELTKPQNLAPGHQVYSGGKVVYTAPEKTRETDLQINYKAAKDQGFVGSIFDYERKLKEAGRAPVQTVAPTITQIVDPSNPNQMITIDARRYQGGGGGAPGVLGIGGKEPTAAVRINKVEAGKTQLADDLDNLRSSFQTLDKLRAVPSTERGAISNVTSALASSRAGQLAGQAFATEAQVERDVINSARNRLVNSIKNATGMSAQQLNSNVELQTMLKSISDPGQSYQSAIRIIDDIEKAYVTGGGALSKRNQPAANVVTNPQFPGFSIPGKQ
jgi:hypothetical protein